MYTSHDECISVQNRSSNIFSVETKVLIRTYNISKFKTATLHSTSLSISDQKKITQVIISSHFSLLLSTERQIIVKYIIPTFRNKGNGSQKENRKSNVFAIGSRIVFRQKWLQRQSKWLNRSSEDGVRPPTWPGHWKILSPNGLYLYRRGCTYCVTLRVFSRGTLQQQ